MSNMLRHPVENFRAAPLGITGLATSSVGFALEAYLFNQSPEVHEAALGTFSVALFAVSAIEAVKFLRLKRELEQSIDANGYTEDDFSGTAYGWCSRQTARVVCGASSQEDLQSYEKTCEKRQDHAELTWLPHI